MARSGILNRVIGLYRKTTIKNEFGEYSDSWNLHKNLRSYVHRNSGKQILDNDEVFDLIRTSVTIRKQTDINEMDRLLIDGDMYKIDFIQQDDTGRWLSVRCTRINE